jgi:hypothetical protein
MPVQFASTGQSSAELAAKQVTEKKQKRRRGENVFSASPLFLIALE